MSKNKHHIYWLIPTIIYLISSLTSVINVDGVRDYLAAYDIVVNGKNTLLGPEMAFSFHMGPIWYYVLAIPMMISKSWLSLSLFVALLTSLKFYMAFKLGKLLLDLNFAILLVFSLLLPSFVFVQQVTFTHTNLIELAILIIIYYCLISDSEKLRSWFVIGLLFALAVHIHPTIGIVSFWIVAKLAQSKHWFKNSLMAIFATIIIFIPLIIYEFKSGFENINGVISYFSLNTNGADYFGFLNLLFGTIFIAPLATYKMLFPTFIANLLFVIYCIFIVSIIPAFLFFSKQNKTVKKLFYQLLFFSLYSFIFVFFIRKTTPWYMTYSISLSFSMLLAISLWGLHKYFKLKNLPRYVYYFGLLVFINMLSIMMFKLNQNQLKPPAMAWDNVRSLSIDLLSKPGYEIPSYLSGAHAKLLCENSPVTVHGPYAALIHSHSGIEYISACHDKQLYYGPSATINQLFAVSNYFKKHIKNKPLFNIGNSYFYQPLSVSNKQLFQQETFLSKYDKSYKRIENWQNINIVTNVSKGQYLAITKVEGSFSKLKINSIKVNDITIIPVAETNYSTLYYCEVCDKDTSLWEIDYSESITGMTNIVSF